MRAIVVGLGIQGKKRRAVAGNECIATVDPVHSEAQYRKIEEVPLSAYDAALVCTPDQPKYDIIRFLLENRKHVLVEKPLFFDDPRQFDEIELLSQKNSSVCYTAYNHRFEPHIVKVKELIESNSLGVLYNLRMFYGNGTAREVRGSPWRDSGMGVLADLGSHLLDTIHFLLGRKDFDFMPVGFHCWENQAYDHVRICTRSGRPLIQLEATLLSWRNTFSFDLVGEKGSTHIDCLCKWGPSKFVSRQRVLPSGRPPEQVDQLECADPTWAKEYDHFKGLCATESGSNLDNDRWILKTLMNLHASFLKQKS